MRTLVRLQKGIEVRIHQYPGTMVLLLAVLLLAVGWLLGLIAAGGNSEAWSVMLEVLTSVGTVGAAVMAWLAVTLTRSEKNRQIRKESEQSRPNLVITEFELPFVLGGVIVTFANIGQFPVLVRSLVHDHYQKEKADMQPVELIVPAGGMLTHEFRPERFYQDGTGELRFFFQYGATGTLFHRLALPYRRTSEDVKMNGLESRSRTKVQLGRQQLTANLGSEEELRCEETFWERVF